MIPLGGLVLPGDTVFLFFIVSYLLGITRLTLGAGLKGGGGLGISNEGRVEAMEVRIGSCT